MDLIVTETLNGGDVILQDSDLEMALGFENVAYLACFGGNVKQDTPEKRLPDQEDFSWWANQLLMPNDGKIQFNSKTERALNENPLTNEGRRAIEEAIISDLSVMSDYVNVTVATQIVSDDRLEASITLVKPTNLQSTTFVYIWEATMQTLNIVPMDIPVGPFTPPVRRRVFDYTFNFTFN